MLRITARVREFAGESMARRVLEQSLALLDEDEVVCALEYLAYRSPWLEGRFLAVVRGELETMFSPEESENILWQ